MNDIEKIASAIGQSIEDNITEDHVHSDCRIHDIWNIFMILAKYKQWQGIDILLEIINPKTINLDDLLSILTCTAWYKQHLTKRAVFVRNAKKRWDCRDRTILMGLE